MEKVNRVLLYGYWENNLGDDLFLKLISERYKNTIFFIHAKKKYRKYYNFSNVKFICSDTLVIRFINKILHIFNLPEIFYIYYTKRCEITVLLGGSIFMESSDWENQYKKVKYLVDYSKKCIVLGSNFGPYLSLKFYSYYKEIFKSMQWICFRDRKSLILFSDLENIYYAPDIVLGLEDDKKIYDKINYKNYYIVSVINTENRKILSKFKHSYEQKLSQIINELIQDNSNILLMSFCDEEGDLECIYRIIKNNKSSNVQVYSHKNITESIEIIKNSKGIIATRFHALILGFVFNIPVFPIIYSPKMENIITDYGFKNLFVNFEELENISLVRIKESLKIQPNIEVETIRKASDQFNYLDKFLNRVV